MSYLDNYVSSSDFEIDVYLYGFDFRSYTADDDILKDSRNIDSIQRSIDIDSQLKAFMEIRKYLKSIKIYRAGFDIYADIDPRTGEIQAHHQNDKSKTVEIVAEITTNHLGDSDRLFHLMRAASYAGADSVKLQMRDVKTFYSEKKLEEPYQTPFGKTFYDYRAKLELTDAQIEKAIELSKILGMKLYFSALDKLSYTRLLKFDQKRIKLPSTISKKTEYLHYVSKNPVEEIVISTGMTDEGYEQFILSKFLHIKKIYLLHCVSSYPVWPGDAGIGIVRRYAELSKKYNNIVPGYSSHDIGELGCSLAVAAGAEMVEKHIKTGINEWVHFDDTAMDAETEFPGFVDTIRGVERMMGGSVKRILASEHHKY